jgi:hypothetical protein
MPLTELETYLTSLKENYTALSQAYRRGDFEDAVKFVTIQQKGKGIMRMWAEKWPMIAPGKRNDKENKLIPFRDAAVRLFEQALAYEEYDGKEDLPLDTKEQLAEYIIRAQVLSYEISDYFIAVNDDMSKHFLKLTTEASKEVRSYYQDNYGFVLTPQVKVNIVKQIVLGALSGVNVLYRSYDPTRFHTALTHADNLIQFLERDYSEFCERSDTAFGLIGLAYFLKGRLLLGTSDDNEADRCFRLSAENYVKKLGNRGAPLEKRKNEEKKEPGNNQPTSIQKAPLDVSVSELLALRRAALTLAFGSGYSALINSRVKEANRLLTLARGILYFNAPKVYASYIELLYWSAKRAENSNDPETLLEAKKRIEECRDVFEAQVNHSHYPHRASIEHSLVLHYLAQQRPAEAAAYYVEAERELKAAIEFAEGDGATRKLNKQLYTEACYILSHLLRYQSANVSPTDAKESIDSLKAALDYAQKAEGAAKDFPRHDCEALLALCGVYAEIAKRGIELSKVDPQATANADPARLSRNYACKVLDINKGANPRISAVCHLRLVDYYLKTPATYSRAYTHWEEWLKIRDFIEHAFVNDWAARTEAAIEKTKERTFVLDFADIRDVNQLRDKLYGEFARRKISEWALNSHSQYQFEGEEIKQKKELGRRGPNASLRKGLENFLQDTLNVTSSEAKVLIENHGLLTKAKEAMASHLKQ